METLEELRAAVHSDPRRVAQLTSQRVNAARAAGDAAALSSALAVRGRARRALGEVDLAEADLRGAIEAAEAATDHPDRDELAADAHLGLAGPLSYAGRSTEAFAHLDAAYRLGSERIRAYTSLQRAIVSQRIGQTQQALANYAAALPVLRAQGAHLDIAMVLLNRGVLWIEAGDFPQALADLAESSQRYAREGHDYGVAQTDHGVAWAHARRGDLPAALQYLDRAAGRFRSLGHPALEIDADRVEVLLAAGLFEPALDLAASTARRLTAAGNHSLAAEMWVLCARASLLGDDRPGAARYAEQARVLFAEQGSVGWERAARLELLRSGASSHRSATDLEGLATELDDVGNARGAVTALALAAVAACEAGETPRAARLATRSGQRAARLGIFEVDMLAAYARAQCAAAAGELATATRLVRSGLAGLHRHRTALVATDARAAVAVHARQLAALGLRLALATGKPATVLEWMERARAGRGQHPPPRPPADPDLAAGLAQLRTVMAQLRERESTGQDPTDLLRTRRELERAIQARQLRAAAPTAAAPATGPTGPDAGAAAGRLWRVATARELRAALRGQGLVVALAEIDDQLVGVRVGGRRSHLADLGSATALTRVMATVMATMRLLVRPGRPAGARHEAIERLGRGLAIIDQAVAGLLAGDGPIVLVVPAALHPLPWSLLPCLAGRPVVVAPSATWWYRTQVTHRAEPAGAPVVAAGPHLAEAEAEAVGVAACYPDAAALTGAAATSEAVLAGLPVSAMAHLACHGRVRHDNPLWSSLELADGPLYVYDVEQLPRTSPLVILSGCETGVAVRAGDELLGLATALLRHGTRCLVASVCALPDTPATRETMIGLHLRIRSGLTAPAALAGLTAGGVRDEASLLAASLGCFGAH